MSNSSAAHFVRDYLGSCLAALLAGLHAALAEGGQSSVTGSDRFALAYTHAAASFNKPTSKVAKYPLKNKQAKKERNKQGTIMAMVSQAQEAEQDHARLALHLLL